MTAALRSRLAIGVLGQDEVHAEWMPYRHRGDGRTLGVVVGLSHNADVPGYFTAPYDKEVRAIAAAGMAVVVPGSSGTSWGNDDAIDSIDRAVTYLRDDLGCRKRVALLGFSMGAIAVCGWARRHTREVSAVALVTPVLDLVQIHEAGMFQQEIERAYGGAAAFRAAIFDHDPMSGAESLRSLPTRIWYSSDDPIIPWQSAAAFADRHGGEVTLTSLGPVGHDPAAANGGDIAEFLAAHT